MSRNRQDVLIPDGLHYSPKTKEYRTSNIHLLLEITGCFTETWASKQQQDPKTKCLRVSGSRDSGYKIESESFKLSHISGTQPYKGVP